MAEAAAIVGGEAVATYGTYAYYAAVAASAVAAVASANASYQQAQMQATAANQQADRAQQQATTQSQIAAHNEEMLRQRNRRLFGEQTAAIAQSGLAFSGSPLNVARETTLDAELDALSIRYEGQLRAHDLRTDAQLLNYEADNYRFAGSQARTVGYLNAASTLAGGYARRPRAPRAGLNLSGYGPAIG